LAEAAVAARSLVVRLADACERIYVAGSIRRGKADVGDIELVAVPRFAEVPDGMFETRLANLLTERVDSLLQAGVLGPHPTDPKRGEKYSKLVHLPSGLQVDLFSARPETFGIIYLIRTGPADYSQRFVTDLHKRGLHVAGGELHLGGLGCDIQGCEVVPAPEEADVYAAAGWPFIWPADRA
jgi:DNA polymerase/3'-5' exonuclease PolX